MKVRERMVTSVRTMVKVKVTTDGDQHQDDGECDYRSMGERGRRRVCEDNALETAWLRPAL